MCRHPHHATPAGTLMPKCAGESIPSLKRRFNGKDCEAHRVIIRVAALAVSVRLAPLQGLRWAAEPRERFLRIVPISTFSFASDQSQPIELFSSDGARSVELAHGSGESHVYAVHIAPGGIIGPHPAGFDQFFLVVQGSGWVAGGDGVRIPVSASSGAFIPNGEVHSKGSDVGMLALMFQASAIRSPQVPGNPPSGHAPKTVA